MPQDQCPHCGYMNNPGRHLCWSCKQPMTPPAQPAAQPTVAVQPAPPRPMRLHRDGRWFAVLCLFMPLFGAIFGLYHLADDDPDARRLGRYMLIWCGISLLLTSLVSGLLALHAFVTTPDVPLAP